MNDSKKFNDLFVFIHVAKLGSFTQASKVLNVQPSALSHRMNELERRLKLKLLNRTTRSVSTTEAGQQLLDRLAPLFATIQHEISSLSDYTEKMSGKIRINSPERPAFELIYPIFNGFVKENPDVELEIFINNNYCDIVAERFDFGVRMGDTIAQDMIAVPISNENTMSLVASPKYIDQFGMPKNFKELAYHRCVVLSFTSEYRLNDWEFISKNQQHKIRVPENFVFNSLELVKKSAIDGLGIAWLSCNSVKTDIEAGRLVKILNQTNITYPPMYLYYPKNKYKTPATTALIELLRYKSSS